MTDRAHNCQSKPLFDGMDATDPRGRHARKVGGVTRTQLLDLLKRQEYRCALTGTELTPETASVDHKIPVQQGGGHSIENLHIVEHRVNWAKGTMTTEEFVDLCRRVVEHNDRSHGSLENV